MAECFVGVSTEATEKFFMNMIVSDVSLPHTSQRLSPITFCEFMARNQVFVMSPLDIYEEANKVWRKFVANGKIIQVAHKKEVDLDQADIKHDGWNVMIDHLNRLLHVTKMSDYPSYQMHYIAHVCHNFYQATLAMDPVKCAAYRTLWNEVVSPVLYEPLVPTRYAWLPVENYTDLRFGMDLAKVVENANGFILSHIGRLTSHREYDASRCEQIKQDCEATIKAIYESKYTDYKVWSQALSKFIARNELRIIDAEICELYPQFKVNGMRIIPLFEKIERLKKRFEKGLYEDDPDEAIDDLLDIRPRDNEPDDKTIEKEIKQCAKKRAKE